jgi:hypothetical protein
MPRASEEKQTYWRSVLRRQRKSGRSVRQFCAEEDLCCASFYRWKRKIANDDCQAGANSGRNGRKRPQASPVARHNGSAAAFIPVRLATAAGGLLEVVHPRGHVVRVPAVFDANSLRQVLDVLDRQGGA